jgi:hypothetical protein
MTTYDITSRTSLEFLWGHPQLQLFPQPIREIPEQKAKLYLVPTSFGEEYDPDFAPVPCSAADLPELHAWTMKFAVCVLEIWAGRRQPVQLATWCHRVIFSALVKTLEEFALFISKSRLMESANQQSWCDMEIAFVRWLFALKG